MKQHNILWAWIAVLLIVNSIVLYAVVEDMQFHAYLFFVLGLMSINKIRKSNF